MSASDARHLTWTDPHYPYTLDRLSCMHYFEFSPFFTPDSTNSLARRSNLDPGQPGVIDSFPPGLVEYILEKEQPPHLFVIRKQLRPPSTSPSSPPTILAYYYILDKVIYQAPTLHEALNARVMRCSSMLYQSFEKLREDLEPLGHLSESDKKTDGEEKESAAVVVANDKAMAMDEGEGGGGAAGQTSFKWLTKASDKEAGRRHRAYSEAEETRMNRAANMIDTVLSQLPLPKLPLEYVELMPEHMRPSLPTVKMI